MIAVFFGTGWSSTGVFTPVGGGRSTVGFCLGLNDLSGSIVLGVDDFRAKRFFFFVGRGGNGGASFRRGMKDNVGILIPCIDGIVNDIL